MKGSSSAAARTVTDDPRARPRLNLPLAVVVVVSARERPPRLVASVRHPSLAPPRERDGDAVLGASAQRGETNDACIALTCAPRCLVTAPEVCEEWSVPESSPRDTAKGDGQEASEACSAGINAVPNESQSKAAGRGGRGLWVPALQTFYLVLGLGKLFTSGDSASPHERGGFLPHP